MPDSAATGGRWSIHDDARLPDWVEVAEYPGNADPHWPCEFGNPAHPFPVPGAFVVEWSIDRSRHSSCSFHLLDAIREGLRP